jgi:hypothetical protein
MPTNRPSPDELLVAIREYLEQDIKPFLSGVVVNTCVNTSINASASANAVDESATKSIALNNAIAINLLKLLERESQLRD